MKERCSDETAWSLLAELGVLPGRATVALAYLNSDSGAATGNEDNATTIGATYLVTQNVELQVNHTWFSGNKYDTLPANGDQKTYLMIFSAF